MTHFCGPGCGKKNQYITNPHLIYPGNRIHLYPYPYRILIPEIEPTGLAVSPKPSPTLPAPPAKIDLVSYPKVFSAGFIVDDIAGIGNIAEAKKEKTLLSEGDNVYLNLRDDVKVSPGDRFTIFRVEGAVVHPITDMTIGKKVNILGLVRVSQIEDRVITGEIILSFDPILKGDWLMVYLPPNDELVITTFEKPQYGWVVASKGEHSNLVEGDIVYIDRGANDGMKPGHICSVLRRSKRILDPISRQKIKLPDELIGRLVIMATQPKTSTALIIHSYSPIYLGDEVSGVTD